MKKVVNGELLDMTPAEIAEFERLAGEMSNRPPTPEDRIMALEAQNATLIEQNNMLTECVLEISTILYA